MIKELQELSSVNVFNKEDWDEMIDFMTNGMIRIENTFKKTIQKINQNQEKIFPKNIVVI
jgi:predicted transcriptional regulator